MATERIAEIKINTDRLSDDELLGVIGHQEMRLVAAQGDLDKLLGLAAMCGLLAQPDDGQLVLDYEA